MVVHEAALYGLWGDPFVMEMYGKRNLSYARRLEILLCLPAGAPILSSCFRFAPPSAGKETERGENSPVP
jgi:hypothetical protein